VFCLDALVWLAVAAVLALMVLRLETRHWAEQVGRQAEAWMHTCSRHGGSPLLIIQLAVPHTQLRSSRRWLPDCAITSSTLSTHLAPALTPLPPPLARPPARQMFCGALVNHLNVQAGTTMVVALLGSAAYALRCFWRLPPGLGLQRHGRSTWRSKAGLNHLLQLAAVSTLGVRHLNLNSLVSAHRLPLAQAGGRGGSERPRPCPHVWPAEPGGQLRVPGSQCSGQQQCRQIRAPPTGKCHADGHIDARRPAPTWSPARLTSGAMIITLQHPKPVVVRALQRAIIWLAFVRWTALNAMFLLYLTRAHIIAPLR